MIRVLICDDQWLVCEGLTAILQASSGIQVIGEAHDGDEALTLARELHPDVILMDLKMPIMDGVEATRRIMDELPKTRVLVLTTYADDESVFDAIRSGAVGYLLKGTPQEELVRAVRGTAAGESHVDPEVAGKLLRHVQQAHPTPPDTAVMDALTDREMDVLRLLARGRSNDEIAGELFLTRGTVRNYVSSILQKLGVADRTQAALLALRYGLDAEEM